MLRLVRRHFSRIQMDLSVRRIQNERISIQHRSPDTELRLGLSQRSRNFSRRASHHGILHIGLRHRCRLSKHANIVQPHGLCFLHLQIRQALGIAMCRRFRRFPYAAVICDPSHALTIAQLVMVSLIEHGSLPYVRKICGDKALNQRVVFMHLCVFICHRHPPLCFA